MTLLQDTLNNPTVNHKVNDAAVKHRVRQAVKEVKWQDLRSLTKRQVAYNLILPYPFLIMSWWFAWQSSYVLASVCTYLFFAAAFRQAHDGYHRSLGVGKRSTTVVIMLLSVLLLTGLHSIRATHMYHHRYPLVEDDLEGSLAKKSWWQALIGGVHYRFALYKRGMQLSSRHNRRIAWIEFALIGCVITGIIMAASFIFADSFVDDTVSNNLLHRIDYSTYTPFIHVAVYHLVVMLLANAFMGIIAAWSVHHHVGDNIARTERNKLVNLLTFGLLFHVEHHLFPAVPTNHLPILAQRLDLIAPHLSEKRVVPTKQDAIAVLIPRWDKFKSSISSNSHGNRNRDNSDDTSCPIRRRFA